MISSLNRFSGLAAYLGQTSPSVGVTGRGRYPLEDLPAPLPPPVGADAGDEDLIYSPHGPFQPPNPTMGGAKPTHGLSYYEQAMPTRPGFSATALAEAIVDPGKETISAGKTSAQVAQAARTAIDANLKKMAASGEPFDRKSKDYRDAYSAMGTLDRRALNAVANDVGGLFSKDEQQTARQFMNQQDAFAAGGFLGAVDVASKFKTAPPEMAAANAIGYAAWLDKASPDEKATIDWVFRRASTEDFYHCAQDPSDRQNVESSDPRVGLVALALRKRKPNTGVTAVKTLSDLQNQSWMKPYNNRLDAILTSSPKARLGSAP